MMLHILYSEKDEKLCMLNMYFNNYLQHLHNTHIHKKRMHKFCAAGILKYFIINIRKMPRKALNFLVCYIF